MIIEFDTSFQRSLNKVKDKSIFPKIERWITKLELAESLYEMTDIKKLQGFSGYYRIRIGEYRLGFEKMNTTTIRFILIAHRKDIYKLFP